jgi:hypothetical protein
VRVLRVLEYEGPRSWVEDTLGHRGIKGEFRFPGKEAIIREAIIGEFPAILEKEEDSAQAIQGQGQEG